MSDEELPKGWTVATLDDVARWSSGGTPKAGTAAYYGGETPWAVIGDLTDGLVAKTASTITQAGLNNSSAKVVPAGTLLLAMYGSIGKLGIAGIDMATNQAIAAARVEDGVNARFLFWWLYSQRPELLRAGQGGTQANISQSIIKPWPIRLAPRTEQDRIVAEIERRLSHVDAAERSLARAAARLRQARSVVVSAAVDGSLTQETNTETWPSKTLESLALLLRNGLFVSRPGTEPVGTAIFTIGAVRPLKLDTSDIRWANVSNEDRAKYELAEGDLLFIRYNGNPVLVGACARVRTLPQPTVHPDKLIRLTPRTDEVLPAFLELAVASGKAREAIRSAVKTTAGQAGISGADLRRVVVRLPDLATQARIVEEAERRLSLLAASERSITLSQRRCQALRRSILTAAFRGELVAQDPNDEPAGVLLERIRDERAAAGQSKTVKKKSTTTPRKPRAKKEPVG